MVNGCLAYGVVLNKDELTACVEKVCQMFNDTDELRRLLAGELRPEETDKIQRCYSGSDEEVVEDEEELDEEDEEELEEEEYESCIDIWGLHDEFARFFELIQFSQNGACCNVNKDYEYFIGWKSEGERTGEIGAFEIVPPTAKQKKLIDEELANYSSKKPAYYIMAHDCEYCS